MTIRATDWPMHHLGELVDILDSRRVPVSAKERSNRPGNVPYYGASGRVGTIDEKIFDEPLLLLGEDGVQFFDLGKSKSYLIEGPAWVNNHAHVLRARPMVERKFLNYYLNHCDYRGFANGTTRLKLTQAAMRQIPVPVPPLDEQRRIVDLLEDHLSRLDAADAYVFDVGRKATALQWSAFSSAVREIGGEPVTLGELATVKNGIYVSRPPADPDGVPILRIGAIRPLALDLSDLRYSAMPESEINAMGGLLTSGDLLFTRYNGNPRFVGACAVVTDALLPLTYPDKLIRVRPNAERVVSEFLAVACSVGSARAQIQAAVKTTSGQAGISGRDLKAVEISVPSLQDQARVVRLSAEVAGVTRRLEKSVSETRMRSAALRRSLLAAAFSGRLTGAASDVTGIDMTEELASV